MLKLIDDRLTWSRDDRVAMAGIIGADAAVGHLVERGGRKLRVRRIPVSAAIIKAARQRGILISQRCERYLAEAQKERAAALALKNVTDAPGDPRLFKHQRVALHFMQQAAQPAYLNADVPGAGKTAVAIRWMNWLDAERILIVCNNSAKLQWKAAIQHWDMCYLPITVTQGTVAEQIQQLKTARGWVVTHWESLAHARQGVIAKPWDGAVLDEAHRIQNRKAIRTQTAMLIRANHRQALTGHAYTNNPGELFPILQFLKPEEYKSFWRFFHMYVKASPKEYGGFDIEGVKRPKLLRWELAPFTIRRSHKELGWRPLARVPRYAQLTKPMRAEYRRLQKQFFVELEAHAESGTRVLAIPSVLARIMRIRQFLIDPGLIGSGFKSVKYPIVLEIMEDLDGPPVIFTSFEQAALRLQAYLTQHKKRTQVISGTNSKHVERYKKLFMQGKLDALIVITSKGGESLNLGKYGYIIMLDLPWNPRGLEQAEGRVYRPEENVGTMVSCTSYRVVVEDSWEVKRLEVKLEHKNRDFQETFSPQELMELFS